MTETPKDIKATLPAEPSRSSGRWYVGLIFVLAAVEAIVAAQTGYEHWAVLAAINTLPIAALLIAKSATTLDLNKWMDSATQMVEAKFSQ